MTGTRRCGGIALYHNFMVGGPGVRVSVCFRQCEDDFSSRVECCGKYCSTTHTYKMKTQQPHYRPLKFVDDS